MATKRPTVRSTRKASRKAIGKAQRKTSRRPRAQFKPFDYVTPDVAAKPLETYLVDFRFAAHVEVQAASLDDAFAKAKDITVVSAWQQARKHRTQIVGVFTPDHERAKTRSGDIGR